MAQCIHAVMKHIAIIGAGCVGSVLVERLMSSGQELTVSVIAEGKRSQRLAQSGITVNGAKIFPPNARDIHEKICVVFVCVKNYDLEQACVDMKGRIFPDTVIIPLLNSVSPTPALQEFFPDNRVLYGYISKIDAHRENYSVSYNIAGDIHFGEAENLRPDAALEEVREILKCAGFGAYIDSDMRRGVWRKWMLNVGANQISALTEADYLKFGEIPEIEQVLRLAMHELLIIACYEGVNLSTQDISELIEYLTTYPYPKKTSMLQDILAHRKTEVDYISGDIVRLSRKWNCPCPVNLAMYYLIKSKEACYLSENGE